MTKILPEYIPQKSEIYRMVDISGSIKYRAIILMIFSSGISTSGLLALQCKDVKHELITAYENIKIPACSKTKQYYSFICKEATDALKLYLLTKHGKYGRINEEDPLFSSDYNQYEKSLRPSKTMTPRQIQKTIKNSAKLAHVKRWEDVTSNALKKSFKSIIQDEMIGGGHLDQDSIAFFLGRPSSISQQDYFNPVKIEDMRQKYSRLKFGR